MVIKERPRFGAGHVCAGCPWNSKLHTGCVVSGNVRPARTSRRIGENTLQEKKKPVYMRAITAARSKLRIRKSGNPK